MLPSAAGPDHHQREFLCVAGVWDERRDLPTDICPADQIASVVGLFGLLGVGSGLIFNTVLGYVVQYYSYTPVWIAGAVMYPAVWLGAWLILRAESRGWKNRGLGLLPAGLAQP